MKAVKTIMLGWNEKLCGVASIINTHGTRPFPQSNQWIDGVESVPHWLCYFHTFARILFVIEWSTSRWRWRCLALARFLLLPICWSKELGTPC